MDRRKFRKLAGTASIESFAGTDLIGKITLKSAHLQQTKSGIFDPKGR